MCISPILYYWHYISWEGYQHKNHFYEACRLKRKLSLPQQANVTIMWWDWGIAKDWSKNYGFYPAKRELVQILQISTCKWKKMKCVKISVELRITHEKNTMAVPLSKSDHRSSYLILTFWQHKVKNWHVYANVAPFNEVSCPFQDCVV